MTAAVLELPTRPVSQRYSISLNDTTYNLRFTWCGVAGCWILDVADADGARLVAGVPLVTGADLLAQYEYLGIEGIMFVQSDDDATAVPTFDSLGTLGHLYFSSTAAAA